MLVCFAFINFLSYNFMFFLNDFLSDCYASLFWELSPMSQFLFYELLGFLFGIKFPLTLQNNWLYCLYFFIGFYQVLLFKSLFVLFSFIVDLLFSLLKIIRFSTFLLHLMFMMPLYIHSIILQRQFSDIMLFDFVIIISIVFLWLSLEMVVGVDCDVGDWIHIVVIINNLVVIFRRLIRNCMMLIDILLARVLLHLHAHIVWQMFIKTFGIMIKHFT
jgi:hypothetical protein